MPSIELVHTTDDHLSWLEQDEVKAALLELPGEIYERIFSFAEACRTDLEHIESAIDEAHTELENVYQSPQEVTSAAYDAESSASDALRALEGL